MLKIIDEGPKPMRNFRPAKKLLNGAERFHCEHQEEYEARGRPSRDLIARVQQHNTAYPKLRDELDKRHSVTNTNAISNALGVQMLSQPKIDCSSKGRKVQKKNRRMHKRSRVTKAKARIRRKRETSSPNTKVSMLSRIGINKSCQWCDIYPPENKRSANASDVSVDLNMESSRCADAALAADVEMTRYRNEEYELNNYDSTVEIPKKYTRNGSEGGTSDGNCRGPDTSEPSISSYNSFMSMDHEPMVEQE